MGIDELLKPKRAEILRIAARYGASNVRVFGSVARGEAGPESDVDFLMDIAPGLGWEFVDLIDDLRALLGRDVDVLTENSVHWFIRDRVLQEAVPL